MSLRDAVRRRRSQQSVSDAAPDRAQLLELIEDAAGVADHAVLRPWRFIELRGADRERLGRAIVEASGLEGGPAEKLAAKPLRAPLLLAIVLSPKPSIKVPVWEQAASAAGVAHLLSLLLDDAGWGVMWRTGPWVRSEPVRLLHRLAPGEDLLGWLYIGGRLDHSRPERRPLPAELFLSSLGRSDA